MRFFYKKLAKNLFVSKKLLTFAPAFETEEHWRDGRVVDYSSLENYRAERHPVDFQRVSSFPKKLLPLTAPPATFKII